MKTLIQNYTSALSTEPMYINRCLVECGFDSVLWTNPSMSAFDAFDYAKPDLFIAHYKFLTQDIVKYLATNNGVSLALNVTGANKQEMQKIEDLAEGGVKMPLLFTNLYQPTIAASAKRVKFTHLYPAADVFLPVNNVPEYEIDDCILTVDDGPLTQESKDGKKSYHLFSFNQGSDYADFELDVSAMTSFYKKYKNVHMVGDINFVTSQVLFDAMLKSNKVNIKVPESQQEKLDKILSLLFIEQESDGRDIKDLLREQVKRRHNCFARVGRLFRSLKNKEAAQKMEEISEKL